MTVDTFNKVGPGQGRECVLLTPDTPQHPRDIWGSSTPYAELARWLFYGRRARLQVKPDQRQPIPRITHYVRLLSTEYPMYTEELSFSHFIGERAYLVPTNTRQGTTDGRRMKKWFKLGNFGSVPEMKPMPQKLFVCKEVDGR